MRAFAWLACVVTADLPIHCLRDEFVGHWELHISEVTPLGKSSRLVPKLPQQAGRPFCFHSAPNTNSENMEMIQTKTHEEWKAELGRTTTLTAQLTMRSEQEMVDEVSGHSLVAETPHGKGSWTTVYDEGFEARVPLPSGDTALLLATSRYECSDPSSETCGRNGDSIRPDGSVSGYESYCGRTMVGWYSVKSAAGELLGFGCWIGEKKRSLGSHQSGRCRRRYRRRRPRGSPGDPGLPDEQGQEGGKATPQGHRQDIACQCGWVFFHGLG
mmetsp:Transcript_93496/g.250498  ORF Transcript_93496/g.250498 Transcript_93496/m.250498 type:complete len:271 (+) Transcript_93496:51-863(+)